MKKLVAVCALVLTAIVFAGCVNINFQQNGNGTNFSLNVQNVSLPNVSLPNLSNVSLPNITLPSDNETPNPTWGPWSSTPMPEKPTPSPMPEAFKYSAQVTLVITNVTQRLPQGFSEASSLDDYSYAAALTVQVADEQGSPVENATVLLDGRKLAESGSGVYLAKEGNAFDSNLGTMEGALYPGAHEVELAVNGESQGKYNFTLLGLSLLKPAYGARLSPEQAVQFEWSQGAQDSDAIYGAEVFGSGENVCLGESSYSNVFGPLNATSLQIIPSDFEGNARAAEISPGLYTFRLSADQEKLPVARDRTAFSLGSEETVSVEAVIGSIDQCCNPFAPPCVT